MTTNGNAPWQPIIEHGVEIPVNRREGGTYAILREMWPGDSILVPRLRANNWRWGARALGVKVTIRRVSETQARLWRTE